jgi:Fic family protein
MKLDGSPYRPLSAALSKRLLDVGKRVTALRRRGVLTPQTLRDYFDDSRFDQITQSNAIEGSTLTVGDTKLVVLYGGTVTGHDPAFILDAQSLARALDEVCEMANDPSPTDVQQVKRVHELVLAHRPAVAGNLRTVEVAIRGARHRPPRTWGEVMTQMESWEAWSRAHAASPAVLRSSVLHAWLEHVHPFVDGNGRTGRAVANLELIRAGCPPMIFRKKDRSRYLKALASADSGDLAPFVDLSLERADAALADFDKHARRRKGAPRAR